MHSTIRQVTIIVTLVSISLALPMVVEEEEGFDRPNVIDPHMANWLSSQDTSISPNLKDNSDIDSINDNPNNGNNPRSWKDIFKVMARLNDYYVLFGRAR